MTITEIETSAEVQAILDALALVPELDPTPETPDVAAAGAAWPVWAETVYTGGKLSRRPVSAFDVIVVLPAGYGPTITRVALDMRDTIAAALWHAGPVERAEPVLVSFGDGNDMPAIRYRLTPRVERKP